jgi:rod shape-determining protein MreC
MGALAIWLFKYRFFLGLIILESIGAWITFSEQAYHRSRLNQWQIETAGAFQSSVSKITRFWRLDDENLRLNQELALLTQRLSDSLVILDSTSSKASPVVPMDSTFKVDLVRDARVLYVGTNTQHNYLLLNKGSMDGLAARMAVVQDDKIVGQIQAVSPRFARVIPLINTKLRTSALHPASQTTGSLVWTGGSTRYAELMDIPIHIPIKVGDSLVSSSYSSVYPPGFRLGRIDRIETVPGAITYKIRVLLSIDYHRLDHVLVMRPLFQKERDELLPNQD